jgi:hypothetical protein
MLSAFNLKRYQFEFNQQEFYTFDRAFVPHLLGRRGNQTAINTAGSAWKKRIRRYQNLNQANSSYQNPKWTELYNFSLGHFDLGSPLFRPISYEVEDMGSWAKSTSIEDQGNLGEFFRFRGLQKSNLVQFKNDISFRKKIVQHFLSSFSIMTRRH